jgi:hypothetical protein
LGSVGAGGAAGVPLPVVAAGGSEVSGGAAGEGAKPGAAARPPQAAHATTHDMIGIDKRIMSAL